MTRRTMLSLALMASSGIAILLLAYRGDVIPWLPSQDDVHTTLPSNPLGSSHVEDHRAAPQAAGPISPNRLQPKDEPPGVRPGCDPGCETKSSLVALLADPAMFHDALMVCEMHDIYNVLLGPAFSDGDKMRLVTGLIGALDGLPATRREEIISSAIDALFDRGIAGPLDQQRDLRRVFLIKIASTDPAIAVRSLFELVSTFRLVVDQDAAWHKMHGVYSSAAREGRPLDPESQAVWDGIVKLLLFDMDRVPSSVRGSILESLDRHSPSFKTDTIRQYIDTLRSTNDPSLDHAVRQYVKNGEESLTLVYLADIVTSSTSSVQARRSALMGLRVVGNDAAATSIERCLARVMDVNLCYFGIVQLGAMPEHGVPALVRLASSHTSPSVRDAASTMLTDMQAFGPIVSERK